MNLLAFESPVYWIPDLPAPLNFPATAATRLISPITFFIVLGWIPKISLTIFSDCNINERKYNPINISPKLSFLSNSCVPMLPNAKYVIQWNGWINIVYENSFNHAFNACDFPSPILSIEYVIVTNGAIVIKNAIVIILFRYDMKNIIVTKHNTIYANVFANDVVIFTALNAFENNVSMMLLFFPVITSSPALYKDFTNASFIAIIPIII